MEVCYYYPPHGEMKVLDITKIYAEDEEFFTENDIQISMEELGGEIVVYADTGYENEDGDPEEFIETAQGRSCEDVLKALRITCEQFIKENKQ